MGKYLVELTTKAIRELQFHYRSGNKSNILKIEQILKELTENPFEGTGNPEPLKYNLAGYWSRRINKKDRINAKPQCAFKHPCPFVKPRIIVSGKIRRTHERLALKWL